MRFGMVRQFNAPPSIIVNVHTHYTMVVEELTGCVAISNVALQLLCVEVAWLHVIWLYLLWVLAILCSVVVQKHDIVFQYIRL